MIHKRYSRGLLPKLLDLRSFHRGSSEWLWKPSSNQEGLRPKELVHFNPGV